MGFVQQSRQLVLLPKDVDTYFWGYKIILFSGVILKTFVPAVYEAICNGTAQFDEIDDVFSITQQTASGNRNAEAMYHCWQVMINPEADEETQKYVTRAFSDFSGRTNQSALQRFFREDVDTFHLPDLLL